MLKPDYAETHNNLGNTLQILGRIEGAEVSLGNAIVLNPDYAEAHSNLGNNLQIQGRLQDAEASYRKAIALNPELAEAHSNLSSILLEKHQITAAMDAVIISIKIKSTDKARSLFIEIANLTIPKVWDLSLSSRGD